MQPQRSVRNSFSPLGRLENLWATGLDDADPGRGLTRLREAVRRFEERPEQTASRWLSFQQSLLDDRFLPLLTAEDLDRLRELGDRMAGTGLIGLQQSWFPLAEAVAGRGADGDLRWAADLLTRLYRSARAYEEARVGAAVTLARWGADGDDQLALYADLLSRHARVPQQVLDHVGRVLATDFADPVDRIARAAELARRLAAARPGTPGIDRALGFGELLLHDRPAQAVHRFEIALRTDPDDTAALHGLLAALLGLGQYARAIEAVVGRERTLTPRAAQMLDLCRMLAWLEEVPLGVSDQVPPPLDAGRLAAIEPGLDTGPWQRYALGRACLLEGDHVRAREHLAAVCDALPDRPDLAYHAAWAELLTGDPDAAARRCAEREVWALDCLLLDAEPDRSPPDGLADRAERLAPVVRARLWLAGASRRPVLPEWERLDVRGAGLPELLEALRTLLGVELARERPRAAARLTRLPLFTRLPYAEQLLWHGVLILPRDPRRGREWLDLARSLGRDRAAVVLAALELRAGRPEAVAELLAGVRGRKAELLRALAELRQRGTGVAEERLTGLVRLGLPRAGHAAGTAGLRHAAVHWATGRTDEAVRCAEQAAARLTDAALADPDTLPPVPAETRALARAARLLAERAAHPGSGRPPWRAVRHRARTARLLGFAQLLAEPEHAEPLLAEALTEWTGTPQAVPQAAPLAAALSRARALATDPETGAELTAALTHLADRTSLPEVRRLALDTARLDSLSTAPVPVTDDTAPLDSLSTAPTPVVDDPLLALQAAVPALAAGRHDTAVRLLRSAAQTAHPAAPTNGRGTAAAGAADGGQVRASGTAEGAQAADAVDGGRGRGSASGQGAHAAGAAEGQREQGPAPGQGAHAADAVDDGPQRGPAPGQGAHAGVAVDRAEKPGPAKLLPTPAPAPDIEASHSAPDVPASLGVSAPDIPAPQGVPAPDIPASLGVPAPDIRASHPAPDVPASLGVSAPDVPASLGVSAPDIPASLGVSAPDIPASLGVSAPDIPASQGVSAADIPASLGVPAPDTLATHGAPAADEPDRARARGVAGFLAEALDGRPPEGEPPVDGVPGLVVPLLVVRVAGLARAAPPQAADLLTRALTEHDLAGLVDVGRALPALCARAARARGRDGPAEALTAAVRRQARTAAQGGGPGPLVLARCAAVIGDHDTAEDLWRQALRQTPEAGEEYGAHLCHRAVAAYGGGDRAGALEALRGAAALLPATHAVHAALEELERDERVDALLAVLLPDAPPGPDRRGRYRVLEDVAAGHSGLWNALAAADTARTTRQLARCLRGHGENVPLVHTFAVLYREHALATIARTGTPGPELVTATVLWTLLLARPDFWEETELPDEEAARLRGELAGELLKAHRTHGARALEGRRETALRMHLDCLEAVQAGPEDARRLLTDGPLAGAVRKGVDRTVFDEFSTRATVLLDEWAADLVRTATQRVDDPAAVKRLPEGIDRDYEEGIEVLDGAVRQGFAPTLVLRTALEWHNRWQTCLYQVGERERMREVVEAAARFADLLADRCTEGRSYQPENKALGLHFVDRGFVDADPERAVRFLERARDWDPGNRNAQQLLERRREDALFDTALEHVRAERFDEALAELDRIPRNSSTAKLIDTLRISTLINNGYAELERSRYKEAENRMRKALDLAEELGDPELLTKAERALRNVGGGLNGAGVTLLERAMERLSASGGVGFRPTVRDVSRGAREAKELFLEALRIDPTSDAARENLEFAEDIIRRLSGYGDY